MVSPSTSCPCGTWSERGSPICELSDYLMVLHFFYQEELPPPRTLPQIAQGLLSKGWKKIRWRERAKGSLEVGLDHFEGRSEQGWHPPVTLVNMAHRAFLMALPMRFTLFEKSRNTFCTVIGRCINGHHIPHVFDGL